ncbi:MAG: TetR/AcrR family transcriptional regulator [Actinomycetota bacterium]|nr:TetR/AcrR family transcriptional regulator [Actinomycetota bacterium]MDQ6948572.1 TetR/AcrR family transcriptional regulator [Actinomycetota bacterium]
MVGRPRTVSDDEILDGALVVLSRVGPQGLTLGAVAAEVGLRAPTVSQRFGSKRDLLLALSARAVAQVPVRFAAARGRHRSAVAAMLAALGEFVVGVDSPAAMGHRVAFLAMDLADLDLRRLAAAHGAAVAGEIETALGHAVGAGELAELGEGRTAALARAVHTAYNGSLITWAVDGQGSLGQWISSDIGAVLAPYVKGRSAHA